MHPMTEYFLPNLRRDCVYIWVCQLSVEAHMYMLSEQILLDNEVHRRKRGRHLNQTQQEVCQVHVPTDVRGS